MPELSHQISIKTPQEIKIMKEGGKRLKGIKERLFSEISSGKSADKIDKLADKLIAKAGGKPSFKMVPGYSWATCINVNSGLVHGIPKKVIVFKEEDIVSLDIGLYYQGFHTDTSFTKYLGKNKKKKEFLQVGKSALKKAIHKTQVGNYIFDLSKVIEEEIKESNYQPVKALVGHGIGKNLHEEPQIPCFIKGLRENSVKLVEGMTLAIEVMYAEGSGKVEVLNDGWTIVTSDDKISALFEDTVLVASKGPKVLTGIH